MGKLTKTAIDALAIPAKGQAFLWDSELRGFGVRVIPSGLKAFVVQYRNEEGRSRRIVIGRYGILTVEQARKQAILKLAAVVAGADPAEERAQSRAAITIREVCNWYLENAEAGTILGRKHRPIKASTLAMDRSRIETHIVPLIGTRQVRALRIADIEKMQMDIVAGKTARPRKEGGRGGKAAGGPGVAVRAVSTLQSLLSHALRYDIVENNPAAGVRKIAGKARTRRLSAAEIRALGEAMEIAERNEENPTGLAAVRALMLTGYRISEVIGMERSWLHADRGYVHFPDTKTDGQVRPIGQAAIQLLKTLPEKRGLSLFFPSDFVDRPYSGVPETLRALCAIAGIKGVTPHVLRHTFGSVAGDMGFSELTIKALLGHGARGSTQNYVHIDEALRLAVERVSSKIDQLLRRETAVILDWAA
ncbi:MAG: integrase arm-type DNA-binding domain-containing protein [Sphingomonadaceae bacterium]|nr:integrase arm-type DNA-binding domain-containing protein [Sphingomonadaceae bacterium]